MPEFFSEDYKYMTQIILNLLMLNTQFKDVL